MQALLSLSRTIDRLNTVIGKYSIWLIFAATFISTANAIVRKVFDTSSNAFLEVQWYLFAWSFLIAAGYTLLHREHVRIDVLNSRLPKKTQIGIEIFGLLFFLTPVCLLVIWLSTPMLMDKFTSGELSPNPGGLVRWPVWAALPFGFGLLLLQGWSELIKCIAFLRGLGPDPTVKLGEESAEEELIETLRQHQAQAAASPAPAAPATPSR